MEGKLTPHLSTWPFVTLIHTWIWILLERSLPNYITMGNLEKGSEGGVLINRPLSEEAAVWATVAAEVQAIAESSPYCDDELPKLGRWLCTRAIGMEFSQTRLNPLAVGGRDWKGLQLAFVDETVADGREISGRRIGWGYWKGPTNPFRKALKDVRVLQSMRHLTQYKVLGWPIMLKPFSHVWHSHSWEKRSQLGTTCVFCHPQALQLRRKEGRLSLHLLPPSPQFLPNSEPTGLQSSSQFEG